MTEREWLKGSHPQPMLYYLHRRREARRRRLFACACCRRVWHLLTDSQCREAVEVAERFANSLAGENERAAAHTAARLAALDANARNKACPPGARDETFASWKAAEAAVHAVDRGRTADAACDAQFAAANPYTSFDRSVSETTQQANLVRDIFGNPFRPVAFDPGWRTSAAVALASQMYESRDFGAMPILADALQDAGCDNPDVLKHCRDSNGVHVRGCWVVDLVLGKG